jgi:hypothetical protein
MFENMSFVEMESSKLINYLFDKHVWKWPRYYYATWYVHGIGPLEPEQAHPVRTQQGVNRENLY